MSSVDGGDGSVAFPFTAPDPVAPPPEYAQLLRDRPVVRARIPSGDPVWLVARHEDVRRVLSDRRFSREAITAPGAPRLLPIAEGSKSVFVMDPPEHTRLRRLVAGAFSPARMRALRPEVERLADELVTAMAKEGPPADLMAGLAGPLPITVICRLLGVPYEDVGRFRAWTDIMLSFAHGRREEVVAARQALSQYLTGLIAAKRARPTDDVLMALIEAADDGDRLDDEELLAFGYTLLGAGYHATTAGLTHAVLALLRRPGELRRLRERPELLPAAVEELLRTSQAGGGLGALRIATEDVELSGVRIAAGEAVLPLINAANRDPAVFTDPDTLCLDRELNPHLSFGHGIHHCLGAQLGRMELQAGLAALLRILPGLRLAVPETELTWSAGLAFARPDALPVTW
ncbi:cytochrome P450 [Streptomyces mashuensis]|uniref:Cytochrome P450 n=1 Tax=Streptomyces mashuensis TaxID=33904 RepID=A0A919EFI7_9ACTN|nr:cytochrome P450 [Streptomyces mashuensis]GHF65524.1 cytochrome P450 [Streptomyces mashuensis]